MHTFYKFTTLVYRTTAYSYTKIKNKISIDKINHYCLLNQLPNIFFSDCISHQREKVQCKKQVKLTDFDSFKGRLSHELRLHQKLSKNLVWKTMAL